MWNSGAKTFCINVGERNDSGGSLHCIHHNEHAMVNSRLEKQITGCAVQNRFPGWADMNLLFNCFEGSNEEKVDRQHKKSFYNEIWGDAV